MKTYRIFKNNLSYYKNFASLQEAIDYTMLTYGNEYQVELSNEQFDINPTTQQRLESDMLFGKNMIQEFLIDNRELGNIPVSDQLIQLEKFKDVNTLLGVGALKASYDLIGLISTDQYFTQQRKDKYLNEIYSYLMTNYGKI